MSDDAVTMFKPYVFRAGQRIRIEGGPRSGDWEVLGTTPRKVRLRCPVSGREVEWARFCYFTEERQRGEWPQER